MKLEIGCIPCAFGSQALSYPASHLGSSQFTGIQHGYDRHQEPCVGLIILTNRHDKAELGFGIKGGPSVGVQIRGRLNNSQGVVVC